VEVHSSRDSRLCNRIYVRIWRFGCFSVLHHEVHGKDYTLSVTERPIDIPWLSGQGILCL
jgi:hypothetical protein